MELDEKEPVEHIDRHNEQIIILLLELLELDAEGLLHFVRYPPDRLEIFALEILVLSERRCPEEIGLHELPLLRRPCLTVHKPRSLLALELELVRDERRRARVCLFRERITKLL